MRITIIDHTKDPVGTIAKCAGACYGKWNDDPKRITRLKQHKHLATFRFAMAIVRIEGVSLVTTHQLVRSKHLDFLQRSHRYSTAKNEVYLPESMEKARSTIDHLFDLYDEAVRSGVPKEEARYILPVGLKSEILVSGNFQAWHDFFRLRVSRHAQQEIRQVAIEIWNQFSKLWPEIWADMLYEDKTLDYWRATK